MILAVLAACHKDGKTPGDPVVDEGTGLLGDGWANPFPSTHQVADGALALRDLPPVAETPLPIERLAWRTGFSPAQVSVLRLDGVDDAAFPDGTGPVGEGSVHVVDLTAGREVRCKAELDAYPDAPEPATLVRPLEHVPVGHDVAVVVTTAAVARPDRFDALLSDAPPPSLADVAPEYRDLVDALAPFVAESDIAVAWHYPVGDGTAPLRSVASQVGPSPAHTFDRVRNLDAGDIVVPGAWRVAEGTFEVTDFTGDDQLLDLQPDGSALPEGATDAWLYVHVPESVKDAPAGTVPVMVFGHGIFGDPSLYLDDPTDSSRVVALADRLGVIVVGTVWRGLSSPDRVVPVAVAGDFGRFPQLTDLLVQGQANTLALVESVHDGELLDDPVFLGASGQPLVDRDHVLYYGISLGGIEGMVLWAQRPRIEHAVFHVGGAMWSTLLERSSNWSTFEILLTPVLTDAADRQVLYAVSQLWWDPVDPMSWAPELASGPDFVLQESIGDEQVANLGTEALARAVGLPVLEPYDHLPDDLVAAASPDRALVLFDPQVGLPPDVNRPAEVSLAHSIPRTWDGAFEQTAVHLESGDVRHFCGGDPCTAENPGTVP